MSAARVCLLIVIFIGLTTSISFAFRPFRTEDTITTPKGGIGLQIENELIHEQSGVEN